MWDLLPEDLRLKYVDQIQRALKKYYDNEYDVDQLLIEETGLPFKDLFKYRRAEWENEDETGRKSQLLYYSKMFGGKTTFTGLHELGIPLEELVPAMLQLNQKNWEPGFSLVADLYGYDELKETLSKYFIDLEKYVDNPNAPTNTKGLFRVNTPNTQSSWINQLSSSFIFSSGQPDDTTNTVANGTKQGTSGISAQLTSVVTLLNGILQKTGNGTQVVIQPSTALGRITSEGVAMFSKVTGE